MLWGRHPAESRVMLHWGLGLVAVIIPIQMVFGDFTGLYVLHYQPEKFAAIEACWQTQQPASEVLMAIPDPWAQRNLFAIEVPKLGSFIASGNWTAACGTDRRGGPRIHRQRRRRLQGLRRHMYASAGAIVEAQPRGGSISPLEKSATQILAVIAEHPDLTLVETVVLLRKRRIRTSRSSLWRFLNRHEITLKKTLQAEERQRADVAAARRRWIPEQGMLDPARLIWRGSEAGLRGASG